MVAFDGCGEYRVPDVLNRLRLAQLGCILILLREAVYGSS